MVLPFIYSCDISLAMLGKLDYEIISSLFYVQRNKVFFFFEPITLLSS